MGAVQQLKRTMHGHENRLNHVAPPQITTRPYYPLVVNSVIANAGLETYYSPTDVINALVAQLGLADQDKTKINIKLHRVDVYGIATASSTDRPAVSLGCSSLLPSIGDPSTPGAAEVFYGIIKKLSDQGNLSESAKVSYSWPAHMADLPMNHNVGFTLASVSGNVANTLVRFHVLWSSTDVAIPREHLTGRVPLPLHDHQRPVVRLITW
jgi:hypothetical protein